MNDDRRTVAHVMRVWLPRTETWLYSEVTGLGPRWRSRVVANRRINASEFAWDDVYTMRERIGAVRWYAEMAMTRVGLVRPAPSIASELRRLKPEVVHSHFGYVGWANAGLVQALDAKHVVSFYGHDLTRLPRQPRWSRRYREMFARVDRVLCEGPHMYSRLIGLGCPPEKARVLPLGVPVDRIAYRAPKWSPDRALRLLLAASFREKKGLPDGLRAIGLLKARRPELEIAVTVVGSAGSSAEGRREEARIHETVEAASLKGIAEFRGSCKHEDFLDLARHHDLFVSPSVTSTDGDTEGGAPVGIIEMAALGLPVVSTRHCDIPFVLGSANRKLLVEEHDVEGLSATLAYLVDHPEDWIVISKANRAHVEANLNVAVQGPALAEIYEAVLRGSATA